MGISLLYESTDTSAPVLYDHITSGTLIQVLRACLVNGYGAKSSLGWTEVFVSGNISVFRNNGTGLFFKVDNSVNYAATGVSARLEVFESMKDITTGFLRTPETGLFHYLAYANTKVGTRVIKWKIIGDDKGFWFCSEYSTTVGLWTCMYFGDYIPYHLENKSNWITMSPVSVEVGTTHLCQFYSTLNVDIRIARSYSNVRPSSKIYLLTGYGGINTGASTQLGNNASVFSPFNIFTKPYLVSTPAPFTHIGEIPGLYEPANVIPSGTVVNYSPTQNILVLSLNANNGRIGILIGEGFRS